MYKDKMDEMNCLLKEQKTIKKKSPLHRLLVFLCVTAALAALVFAVYRFFAPDYSEDFEDDFDDEEFEEYFDDEK